MTATERLRQLLDERGVEWVDHGYENHVWWEGIGGMWTAGNRWCCDGWGVMVEAVIPPEQAIEATLGRGTCRNVGHYVDPTRFKCSECEYNGWVTNAVTGKDDAPRYCPSCGRKVVE